MRAKKGPQKVPTLKKTTCFITLFEGGGGGAGGLLKSVK